MNCKNFLIGTFSFQINYPEEIQVPEHFMLFEAPESLPEYYYELRIVDEFEELIAKRMETSHPGRLAIRKDFSVYAVGSLELRLLGARGTDGYYGLYEEISDTGAQIWLNRKCQELWGMDTVFCSLFALERQIANRNGMVLHCSFAEYHKQGLLFSAPSGVGKSTQAELWRRYRGAKIINGDRALLGRKGNEWYAYGWPVCGSSKICANEAYPIRAVVLLSQGLENRITKPKGIQAYAKLFGEITINRWNKTALNRTMDLLGSLTGCLPIYELACTISKEAVDCLADELEEIKDGA